MRVVITGANRGIGLGLVKAFLGRGDDVHAAARRPEQASALNELAAGAGGKLRVHQLDVVEDAAAERLGEELRDLPVHLLINNAGVGSSYTGLANLDLEEALEQFNVNALGPLRVTRALLDNVAAARGKIVNVSSTMGSIGDNTSGRAYPYRMSKVALNMATKNMALELGKHGVTVVVINPGWVQTDMGGISAPTPVSDAVANIVTLIDRLRPEDTGKFLHAEGRELPW
jgi:NAD(P)-dependent dehydrogenase (short-subunit alcohol dehydrogenase family)